MGESSGTDGRGWFPDPTWRHAERFYDASTWTDRVRDASSESLDPLGPLPSNRDSWLSPEVMVRVAASARKPVVSTPKPTWRRDLLSALAGGIAGSSIALASASHTDRVAITLLSGLGGAMVGLRISMWIGDLLTDDG